jgi:hypothetical protein
MLIEKATNKWLANETIATWNSKNAEKGDIKAPIENALQYHPIEINRWAGGTF